MEQGGAHERASRNEIRDAELQGQLRDRRRKLQAAASNRPEVEHLVHLLHEVDAALERMEAGAFGICETCHDSIENDRLLVDPLCRNCLDHLSDAERRALERDLDLAFQVQNGLLPKSGLAVDGWTVAYHYEPAGPVSGDYCDLIVVEPGTALFVLGDISGKGVAASMLMTQLHAIFRSLIPSTRSLPDLLTKANRIFCEGVLSSHFATLVCGWLTNDGGVEICNAGHCLPLHVHQGGVSAVASTDLPLGLFCESRYSSRRLEMEKGDSLVLFTDGLSETFDASGVEYGTQRLSELLRRHGRLAPKELLARSLGDLVTFRAGAARTDDLSIMIIRRDS